MIENNEKPLADEETTLYENDEDEREPLSAGKKILYVLGTVIGAVLLVWQLKIAFGGNTPAPITTNENVSQELPPPPPDTLPSPGATPFNPTLTDDPFAETRAENPFADMLPADEQPNTADTRPDNGPANTTDTLPEDLPLPGKSTGNLQTPEKIAAQNLTTPGTTDKEPGQDSFLSRAETALPGSDNKLADTETPTDPASVTPLNDDDKTSTLAEIEVTDQDITEPDETPTAPVKKDTTVTERASALIDEVCPDCKPIEHTMLELTYINQLAKMLNTIDQNIAVLSPDMRPILQDILIQQFPRLQPIVTNLEAEITGIGEVIDTEINEETIIKIVREELHALSNMAEPSQQARHRSSKPSMTSKSSISGRNKQTVQKVLIGSSLTLTANAPFLPGQKTLCTAT